MIRYDRRSRLLAIGLASLAGFVDAVGFIKMGGLFVAFMSGNSTRLAVGIASGAAAAFWPGLLILIFVSGVVGGSLLSARLERNRTSWLLFLIASLLMAGALLADLGSQAGALGLMTFSMGCANTIFQREGEVSVGVTYMTGTLVKMGQRIAAALQGDDRSAWLPYLLLWTGLVSGAVLGASLYARIGLACLWDAAAAAMLMALWARTKPGLASAGFD
jgi:uncharacterized membrane protein YoaK (UPF0700 family)